MISGRCLIIMEKRNSKTEKVELEEIKRNGEMYDRTIYVADYTNQTNSQRGVEISTQRPNDISSFVLVNRSKVDFYAVNLDRNKGLTGGETQCECLCCGAKANKKRWVLFLEMKYCLDKNIGERSREALSQLRHTRDYFFDNNLLDPETCRVYFNISIPDYSNLEPFTQFSFSQNELLSMKIDEKTVLWGHNRIEILNGSYLGTPSGKRK